MTRTILITGAGSGIGRATAIAFARAGWKVGLIGRRQAALEETAAQMGPGAAGLVIPANVTDAQAVEWAFELAMTEWGRIDCLFNNAGIFPRATTIDELSVPEWQAAVDTNITGAFLCARAAFGHMRRQKPQGGRIINNGSISAHVPRPGSAPYTMSKHAMTGLTKTLALDGRPFDIACGQIDIGNALTDMAVKFLDGVPQADGSIRPEPVMPVENCAEAVLHMATLPLDVNIPFMTIMARDMPYLGRG